MAALGARHDLREVDDDDAALVPQQVVGAVVAVREAEPQEAREDVEALRPRGPRLVRRETRVREARRGAVLVADEGHHDGAARLGVLARFGSHEGTRDGQARLPQRPELRVLVHHPQGLLHVHSGGGALTDGLLGAVVADPASVAVDGVVLEGAHGEVAVELHRDEALGALGEVHGGLLAALELTEERRDDAHGVQFVQAAVREGGLARVVLVLEVVDGAAALRAAAFAAEALARLLVRVGGDARHQAGPPLRVGLWVHEETVRVEGSKFDTPVARGRDGSSGHVDVQDFDHSLHLLPWAALGGPGWYGQRRRCVRRFR